MTQMIEYLKQAYDPVSIIVYGSYGDGSNNAGSDFDALVISRDHRRFHDASCIGAVQLDVFVYPAAYFDAGFDCGEFVQIFDGSVVLDTDGYGLSLKKQVLDYISRLPRKTAVEIRTEIEWCKKMLLRTQRQDAEGMFRWHWLLADSLEIFCGAAAHPYQGPKKSLRWMEREYPEVFSRYSAALFHLDKNALEQWIFHLEAFSCLRC